MPTTTLKTQLRNPTLALPTGPGSREAAKIARIILGQMAKYTMPGEPTYTGGCRTFYTSAEWRARGEDYGRESLLIVCHDGGDVAEFFSYDAAYDAGSYDMLERMDEALRAAGYRAEQCTRWYSAIYPA